MSASWWIARSDEKKFFAKTQYTDTMTCGRQMWLKCALIRDSTEVTITFSPLSMCWVSTHWTEPLIVKNGNEVTKAMAKIIRDDERCPKNLHIDRGKEFYNSDVQKLLKKCNINHYSTYSIMKASIFEWFNCTLKNDIWKQFTHNGSYKWIDILPCVISNYNARKYRTIGMRPNALQSPNKLLTIIYKRVKIAVSARYNVNDSVCTSKFKTVFNKGQIQRCLKLSKCNKLIQWCIFWKIIAESLSLKNSTNTNCIASLISYIVERMLRKRGNEITWNS